MRGAIAYRRGGTAAGALVRVGHAGAGLLARALGLVALTAVLGGHVGD